MNHEEPIFGVTIDAVIKPWGLCRLPQCGEARTINVCKLCYNANLVEQGKRPLKPKEWKEVLEKEAHRGRLWKVFGSEQFLRGMWEYFTLKRAWTRKNLADAAQEKQGGMPGQWQYEFKEVLEQINRSAERDCGLRTMRRACSAMKLGNWESFKEECRKKGSGLCEWTFERLQELTRRWQRMKSAAWAFPRNLEKEHGLLEADHHNRRNGRNHLVACLPALQLFPFG